MAEKVEQVEKEVSLVEPEIKAEVKVVQKTIKQLVEEVVKGAHGTGRERMLSLGDQYEAVQHEVNQLIKKGEVK